MARPKVLTAVMGAWPWPVTLRSSITCERGVAEDRVIYEALLEIRSAAVAAGNVAAPGDSALQAFRSAAEFCRQLSISGSVETVRDWSESVGALQERLADPFLAESEAEA